MSFFLNGGYSSSLRLPSPVDHGGEPRGPGSMPAGPGCHSPTGLARIWQALRNCSEILANFGTKCFILQVKNGLGKLNCTVNFLLLYIYF